MIINHYGITVDSEKPIVGVINNSAISQLIYGECDCYNSDTGTLLIGGWKQDEQGKYFPNETSEYSLIVGETYTQVVWSKQTKRCTLCSPCYPGQGDLDTPGDFLSYDLPPEAYEV